MLLLQEEKSPSKKYFSDDFFLRFSQAGLYRNPLKRVELVRFPCEKMCYTEMFFEKEVNIAVDFITFKLGHQKG
jgi:hypothetical protein